MIRNFTVACFCFQLLTTSLLNAQDPTSVNLAAAVENACVLGITFPNRILTSPAMEMLPHELITTGGMEEFGIDPLTIERKSLCLPAHPPQCGPTILQLSRKPVSRRQPIVDRHYRVTATRQTSRVTSAV